MTMSFTALAKKKVVNLEMKIKGAKNHYAKAEVVLLSKNPTCTRVLFEAGMPAVAPIERSYEKISEITTNDSLLKLDIKIKEGGFCAYKLSSIDVYLYEKHDERTFDRMPQLWKSIDIVKSVEDRMVDNSVMESLEDKIKVVCGPKLESGFTPRECEATLNDVVTNSMSNVDAYFIQRDKVKKLKNIRIKNIELELAN